MFRNIMLDPSDSGVKRTTDASMLQGTSLEPIVRLGGEVRQSGVTTERGGLMKDDFLSNFRHVGMSGIANIIIQEVSLEPAGVTILDGEVTETGVTRGVSV